LPSRAMSRRSAIHRQAVGRADGRVLVLRFVRVPLGRVMQAMKNGDLNTRRSDAISGNVVRRSVEYKGKFGCATLLGFDRESPIMNADLIVGVCSPIVRVTSSEIQTSYSGKYW
jgi:hypothetical protein